MRFASETEMRVLSLRERLVADGDTYLRQLDRIGAGGASNGIGLTVREETDRGAVGGPRRLVRASLRPGVTGSGTEASLG